MHRTKSILAALAAVALSATAVFAAAGTGPADAAKAVLARAAGAIHTQPSSANTGRSDNRRPNCADCGESSTSRGNLSMIVANVRRSHRPIDSGCHAFGTFTAKPGKAHCGGAGA